ncbi:putative ABC-type transport system, periplasmic component/surface lipoprotein [Thermanaerovibrio velox DSM 12556]|uniref:Putative ABC-type transport system, periplasmic component/surface lipoprotein n=1 Tax=Thermanaerovibrio velox DSM 12556 TaxID=926567 RepID=H0UN81_9BACT|nr:BMP family ABC transporter substrate-binding protein [Thermanaerovibrio velox]EHM10366.1 putative ABC-type transport system, periplasmic component/surface lipoprotein [Thermanaerovibrio velox DSM 12556]
MRKKIFTVLLVACMTLSLMASGAVAANKPLKVALILSGFLGDKSFNDSAYNGLLKAKKDFGIELKVLESKNPADWEANLLSMASAKYDVIIGSSTQIAELIKKHAASFPDVKFGVIDGAVKAPNVESIIFAQNEGSFLAGAAAAMFTTKTNIPGVNSKKIIGWVGGMDIPVLQDFLTGYKQGAKYIDPSVKVLVSFAGSFSDPLKGKELALAQFEQGADIVMNVASTTGNGILEAAKEKGLYAIGVDMDQDGIYPGHILTSMIKRVDVATYKVVKDVKENKFKGNTVVEMGVASGGVGLTDMSVMKKALGDKFPKDILVKIKELTEDIKSGKIKVEQYKGFKRDI